MLKQPIVVTLDVDWAPDFMIEEVAGRLAGAGVRATWFATHRSAAVDDLARVPELFELGIHPNFLPGSTHGATPPEVLAHMLELVPEAVSVRNHGLVQSTAILDEVIGTGCLQNDVTHFLPQATGLAPFRYTRPGGTITRVPFFFEDDFALEQPGAAWSLGTYLDRGAGLKVFNFHPVHVYLNSSSMEAYAALKRAQPRLEDLTPAAADPLVGEGAGAGSLFDALVEHLAQTGDSTTISALAADWRARTRGATR